MLKNTKVVFVFSIFDNNLSQNSMAKDLSQALGNFIYTYYTDLGYIRKFQDFKRGKISINDYAKKGDSTFYAFLVEFRVIRNIKKGCVDKVLQETLKWVKGKDADDVDKFAEHLKNMKLTRGIVMRSLASKILFLNNPWSIIPMDRLALNALKQTKKEYSAYIATLKDNNTKDKDVINQALKLTKPFTALVEKDFRRDIKNLGVIRKNRIGDKIRWAMGRNMK